MASGDDTTVVDAVRCGETVFLRGAIPVESSTVEEVIHVVVIVDDNSGRYAHYSSIDFGYVFLCFETIDSMSTSNRNVYCIKKTEEIITSCRSAGIKYRYAGYTDNHLLTLNNN